MARRALEAARRVFCSGRRLFCSEGRVICSASEAFGSARRVRSSVIAPFWGDRGCGSSAFVRNHSARVRNHSGRVRKSLARGWWSLKGGTSGPRRGCRRGLRPSSRRGSCPGRTWPPRTTSSVSSAGGRRSGGFWGPWLLLGRPRPVTPAQPGWPLPFCGVQFLKRWVFAGLGRGTGHLLIRHAAVDDALVHRGRVQPGGCEERSEKGGECEKQLRSCFHGRGARRTRSRCVWSASLTPFASRTDTVNRTRPAWVGVPLSTPSGLSESPNGAKLPEVTVWV